MCSKHLCVSVFLAFSALFACRCASSESFDATRTANEAIRRMETEHLTGAKRFEVENLLASCGPAGVKAAKAALVKDQMM